ncbi:MAG: branched-chain amino acid ABC transporter permease [Pseudomonadota bacterium]
MQIIPKRYLKERHRDHFNMLPFRTQRIFILMLLLAMLWIPQQANSYVLGLVLQAMIAVVGAIGLNFVVGFTGQVSIGQAAYMAIGAYATAVLTGPFGVPFLVALPIAGLITAAASVLVGWPTLRLRGFYLAMATFAVHFLVIIAISRWQFVGAQTGMQVNRPAFATDDIAFYYMVFAIVVVMVHVAFNIEHSFLGRAWGAIRDRDLAAAAAGISLARFKLWANAWSGFYVGIAGGLFAVFLSYISPENFPFFLTVQYLGMLLVGGMGTTLGGIFGALFMTLIPELVRFMPVIFGVSESVSPTLLADVQLTLFGVIIIGTLIFAPKGLFGLWEDIKLYFRTWPFRY